MPHKLVPIVSLMLLSLSVRAQQHFEKQATVCPIPSDRRSAVIDYLAQAEQIKGKLQSDEGHKFTTSHLLESLASAQVCVGEYEQALRNADDAYPAGSGALAELGATLTDGKRESEASEFASQLHHGNHSFYYGVASELAHEGKFAEAQSYLMKIDSPEVAFSARQQLAVSMYQAGHVAEADALLKEVYASLPEKQKAEMPFAEARLGALLETHQWLAAHDQAADLPDNDTREFALIEIATNETDAKASGAKADLLEALKGYDEEKEGPPSGYQLSARLASLRDYEDAQRAATAVHDDEWNQRAWTTIAIFQAEDGRYDDARASLARIGKGPGLINPLDMDSLGRDMARERIAGMLIAKGHPDDALKFLSEVEDKDGVATNQLAPTLVSALAKSGKIPRHERSSKPL